MAYGNDDKGEDIKSFFGSGISQSEINKIITMWDNRGLNSGYTGSAIDFNRYIKDKAPYIRSNIIVGGGTSDPSDSDTASIYTAEYEDMMEEAYAPTGGGGQGSFGTYTPEQVEDLFGGGGTDIWDKQSTELDDKKAQGESRRPITVKNNPVSGQHPGVAEYVDNYGNPVGGKGATATDTSSDRGRSPAQPAKPEPHPNAHKTSKEDVRGVFKFLGLGEPNEDRTNKIVGEINSGERTLTDVRNDLMQYQANQAGTSIEEVAAGHIKKIFEEEGLGIATSKETEKERLDRLVIEVLDGHSGGDMEAGRSFADIRNSLQQYKKDHGGVVHPVEDDTELVIQPPEEEEDESEPVGFGGTGGDSDVVIPVVEEASTVDKVRDVFKSLGINVSDARVKELAKEVDGGRDIEDVRQGLIGWQKNAEKLANTKDEVNKIFKSLGIPAPDKDRLDRIAGEVMDGKRDLNDVKQSLINWQKEADRMAGTIEDINKVFRSLGLSAPSKDRAERIAGEIHRGERDLDHVKTSLIKWQNDEKAKAASVSTGTGFDGTGFSMPAGGVKPIDTGNGNLM